MTTDQPISYWMALARMGFEDDFSRLFDELEISRAALADRLGTTPAYVSKILNGRAGNFQLETMAKLARAIGAILQIRLIKEEGEVVRVVDYETAGALDDMRGAILSATPTQPSGYGKVLNFPAGDTSNAYSPMPENSVSAGAGSVAIGI